mgnify:FL=1
MKSAQALYDLIQINLDRIVDYEKASMQTMAQDLKSIFTGIALQSRNFSDELKRILRMNGDEPDEGASLRGKIYNAWKEIRSKINGDKNNSLLTLCKQWEVEIQKLYDSLLNKYDIATDMREIIENQKKQIVTSFNKLKNIPAV